MGGREEILNINPCDVFKKYNVRPSYHRIRIYEYLKNRLNHPTVDEIYRDLSQEIPTISKTTIYNTLKLFVSKKIVREITIENNELRYDIITEPHAHFKCEICGRIFDLDLEIDVPKNLDGHEVQEYDIFLRGICKECLKREGSKE